jgi:hypothetical protein
VPRALAVVLLVLTVGIVTAVVSGHGVLHFQGPMRLPARDARRGGVRQVHRRLQLGFSAAARVPAHEANRLPIAAVVPLPVGGAPQQQARRACPAEQRVGRARVVRKLEAREQKE